MIIEKFADTAARVDFYFEGEKGICYDYEKDGTISIVKDDKWVLLKGSPWNTMLYHFVRWK